MSTKAVVSKSELPIPDGRQNPESMLTVFIVTIRQTGVPQQVDQAFQVSHQGIVRARTGSANAAAMTVALNREAALPPATPAGADAHVLPANVEIPLPVSNTGRIWLNGTANDTLQISVKGAI